MMFPHRSHSPAARVRRAGARVFSTLLSLGALLVLGPFLPGAGAAPQQPAANVPVRAAGIPYPRPSTPEQLAFFEKRVRPILANRCYNCHSDAFKGAGGLRVDTGIGFFTGSNSGPVLSPGQPEKSLIISLLKSTDPGKRMPQESKQPLPADEIATLESWIKDGAAWPDETEKAPQTPAYLKQKYQDLKAHWWAWQPLKHPTVPSVVHTAWPYSTIDRFVLAKLEANRLSPTADVDPVALIRRLSYDLTGLQPAPVEVKAFVHDHSPRAYAALVDRLLASPQFGERWGRHWLDVARYAESSGPSRNIPYPNAWRYRDYVIDAYNNDLPYNRFLQEQIAGDLLTTSTQPEHDRLTIATGFLALGPKDVNQRFKARFKMDNVDEQIDTLTRSTLALTVSCARCHDHKFDPIPTRDYYALAGILNSTVDAAGVGSGMGGSGLSYYKPNLLGYLSASTGVAKNRKAAVKAQAGAAKKALDDFNHKIEAERKADPKRALTAEERKARAELEKNYASLSEDVELADDLGDMGYGIHCAREGEIADTSIRIRGDEERHGPTVPRGFLTLTNITSAPAISAPPIPADHSGRLELAHWITAPENPLTVRAYVNRIWQHLFGAGIVRTVDNFGSTGDRPSHPELLDYLAQDFIRHGWSTKRMIREIVLSHAYRLGGSIPTGYRDRDPENRLIWRHSPRRLEAEEIRDAILYSSGALNLQRPQGAATMWLRMIEIRDDGPVVHSVLRAADRSPYRSVYLPQLRGEVPRPLAAFDPVTQTLVTGHRDTTTVPAQALFMLNSPFVRDASVRLADALMADTNRTDAQRIAAAYERILAREPAPREVARATAFIKDYAALWTRAHPQTNPASADSVTDARATSTTPDIAVGVIRSDNLDQCDPDETSKQFADETPAQLHADTAQKASWAALVQALYGSAEFQFLR
jgi:hypothetical protein